jgi:integrase/recombinase XerD
MKISEAMAIYLREKRFQGLRYDSGGAVLLSFQRFITDLPIGDITSEQVRSFLDGTPLSYFTWLNRRRILALFFEYWLDRGYMSALSLPQRQRRPDDRHSIPFVYTKRQVRQLIRASQENQSNQLCLASGATLRTVLLTLYGTAALPSEIFWLKRVDLDLKRDLIFLHGNGTIKARTVPLNRDLHALLISYLQSKERRTVSAANVFVSRSGGPLSRYSLQKDFARLRTHTGIARFDGSKLKPRMRDLRQTFAVHRIATWIEERADLNRMLPALSAYMGLSDVSSTQRFLFMTPDRFKGVLKKLSPYSARKHWREDTALISFLAGLK